MDKENCGVGMVSKEVILVHESWYVWASLDGGVKGGVKVGLRLRRRQEHQSWSDCWT